jgi:hypothetical protein
VSAVLGALRSAESNGEGLRRMRKSIEDEGGDKRGEERTPRRYGEHSVSDGESLFFRGVGPKEGKLD